MKLIYFLYFINLKIQSMYMPKNIMKGITDHKKNMNNNEKLLLYENEEELIPFIYQPEHFEDIFFDDDLKDVNKNNQSEIKQRIRNKNTILAFSLSIFFNFIGFFGTIINFLTCNKEDMRITGVILNLIGFLITTTYLIFKKYKSCLKWIGLLYLFILSWLFFLSSFVISQIGSYEGIYAHLSGNAKYSDFAIPIWLSLHISWLGVGIGLLLQYTQLTHYEIALFCLNN